MNVKSGARLAAIALLLPLILGACRDDKNTTTGSAESAAPPATAAEHTGSTASSSREAPAPAPAARPVREEVAAPPPVCADCGTVSDVRSYQVQGQGSGVGIAIGAVAGGLLGHQVGGGTGKKIATVAGAVGGGYAGNEIEKRRNAQTRWEVAVSMEDGSSATLPYDHAPGVSVGQKVRVVNGQAIPR